MNRCLRCNKVIPKHPGAGRPAKYCGEKHRKAAYRERIRHLLHQARKVPA